MRLTEKPIISTLFVLAWPIMLGQGFHLAYNLIDTFWVGQLGADELAAITLSFPLLFVLFSIGIGFSVAGLTLVSQHTGAKQKTEANFAAGQVLTFAVIISLIFMIVGLLFGEKLLELMRPHPDVLGLAWDYFQIVLWGAPFIFIYHIFTSILQGVGNTKTPMKIKGVTVLINIILDPFLIFGWFAFPGFGIKGAAIATVFSRILAAAVALFILFSKSGAISLTGKDIIPRGRTIKKIVKIGAPAAVGMSALSIAMAVMTYIVTLFGTYVLAAWGIVSRITSFIRLPSQGLARATGVLVGQDLGDDKPKKAELTAWLGAGVTAAIMLSLALITYFFASHIINPFTANSEVIEIGTTYLKIAGFAYAFLGVQMVLSGALKGAGATVAKMVFRILTLWVFQIPFSLLLAYGLGWGSDGIWWGIFFAKLMGCLFLIVWFRRGTWKKKRIKKKPSMD